jgi:hypothetical protein
LATTRDEPFLKELTKLFKEMSRPHQMPQRKKGCEKGKILAGIVEDFLQGADPITYLISPIPEGVSDSLHRFREDVFGKILMKEEEIEIRKTEPTLWPRNPQWQSPPKVCVSSPWDNSS